VPPFLPAPRRPDASATRLVEALARLVRVRGAPAVLEDFQPGRQGDAVAAHHAMVYALFTAAGAEAAKPVTRVVASRLPRGAAAPACPTCGSVCWSGVADHALPVDVPIRGGGLGASMQSGVAVLGLCQAPAQSPCACHSCAERRGPRSAPPGGHCSHVEVRGRGSNDGVGLGDRGASCSHQRCSSRDSTH
jgi:hypothetical protein